VSLRSYFRVVVSVMISGIQRCSVRLDLQLFIEGLMFYLRYLYLFADSGVFCFCFVFLRHVSCLPNVASFAGFSN
jgi:hypothetical protein